MICERIVVPIIPIYNDPLKVHIMPHSHMDISWLDGFNETYEQSVRYICTNVVSSLMNGGSRTFVFAEVGFIKRLMED